VRLNVDVGLQKLPMKDFAAEIRAHLDVEQFLSQAQLMLDVHETNMERILDVHGADPGGRGADHGADLGRTWSGSWRPCCITCWTVTSNRVTPRSTTPRKFFSLTIPVHAHLSRRLLRT